MSRARMGGFVAFFGILITTGGCAGSATAPEAALLGEAGASMASGAAADSTATMPASPGRPGDGTMTTSSGFILGGGRE